MRLVQDSSKFVPALEAVQSEAVQSFGCSKVLLERYFAKARHVEVQVFGDGQGHAVHLFSRECSIQRRYQKIIEEAPVQHLSASKLRALHESAVSLAKNISYLGAGTVEYLLDEQDNFYFMEMNTRLQVEHPVTEMITGQDLVYWQLQVAFKQTLPLTQSEIMSRGHA